MEFETKREAVEAFVKEMNAFPQGIIEILMRENYDGWYEVTVPTEGDRVYAYRDRDYGQIIDYDEEKETYTIELENKEVVELEEDEFEVENYGILPMWGTMWQFDDGTDDYWLEELDGIREMSKLGFRIYEFDEWGYFFGIDGAGYNFYEQHWIPLYDARGLKWHKEEEEG